MVHHGSCHCGRIRFEFAGDIPQVIECNCSHCGRKGYLLHFMPRAELKLLTPAADMSTYTFNKHVIEHKFCPKCGAAPLGFGTDPRTGGATAAINVRCIPELDRSKLKVVQFDGARM